MRTILMVLLAIATMTSAAKAEEDYYSLKDELLIAVPETFAHGCYYHRGRRYCSRYCYWEENGRRYCQGRLRQAYPQAYNYLEDEADVPEARYRPRSR